DGFGNSIPGTGRQPSSWPWSSTAAGGPNRRIGSFPHPPRHIRARHSDRASRSTRWSFVNLDKAIPGRLREDLGDLREQIVAVGAPEGVHARAVPPLVPVVGDRTVADRFHLGSEARIEEEWERKSIGAAAVAHAVRGRAINASRHAIEHV